MHALICTSNVMDECGLSLRKCLIPACAGAYTLDKNSLKLVMCMFLDFGVGIADFGSYTASLKPLFIVMNYDFNLVG